MRVRIGESEHDVELLEHDGERIHVRIDGREYHGSACKTKDGAWSVLLDGRSWEGWVAAGRESRDEFEVAVAGVVRDATLQDPRMYRGSAASGAGADGWIEIKAPMPGKVVAVLVSEGDAVEKGDGLVVVEAMKMENEFSSPKAGSIAQVFVEPGQAVEAGQRLISVE